MESITDFIGGGWKNMLGKKEVESAEEHDSTPSAGDEINWVTCMRCGVKEEGEESLVGDETYYLCECCDSDMND